MEISSRAEPIENKEKTLTMECPFSKRGSVAVYLRSLRIITAEEKNIPGRSRELMDCKKNTIKVIFHISPNFHVNSTNFIRSNPCTNPDRDGTATELTRNLPSSRVKICSVRVPSLLLW